MRISLVFLTRQAIVQLQVAVRMSDSVAVSESESDGVVASGVQRARGRGRAVVRVVAEIVRHRAMALVTGDFTPLFLTALR